MKRTITLILIIMIASLCRAASPSLECAKIFDRKDIRTEGRDLVKISQPNNYFMSVTAKNDKELEKIVRKAFEQDKKRTNQIYEGYDGTNGWDYSILNINYNGAIVNIGFYWNGKGYVNLFMQSSRPFK